MILVIDASAAVKIALQLAERQLSKTISEADVVIAPDLFLAEVCNVFWKYHRFQQMPLNECNFLIDHAINLADEFISAQDFYEEAFALAVKSGSTVYDAIYLVLTRRRNGFLATADKQLARIAKNNSIKLIQDIEGKRQQKT